MFLISSENGCSICFWIKVFLLFFFFFSLILRVNLCRFGFVSIVLRKFWQTLITLFAKLARTTHNVSVHDKLYLVFLVVDIQQQKFTDLPARIFHEGVNQQGCICRYWTRLPSVCFLTLDSWWTNNAKNFNYWCSDKSSFIFRYNYRLVFSSKVVMDSCL